MMVVLCSCVEVGGISLYGMVIVFVGYRTAMLGPLRLKLSCYYRFSDC
jgi:hypothetical protein